MIAEAELVVANELWRLAWAVLRTDPPPPRDPGLMTAGEALDACRRATEEATACEAARLQAEAELGASHHEALLRMAEEGEQRLADARAALEAPSASLSSGLESLVGSSLRYVCDVAAAAAEARGRGEPPERLRAMGEEAARRVEAGVSRWSQAESTPRVALTSVSAGVLRDADSCPPPSRTDLTAMLADPRLHLQAVALRRCCGLRLRQVCLDAAEGRARVVSRCLDALAACRARFPALGPG